jgi:DNA-binding SARP family transcriptional activator
MQPWDYGGPEHVNSAPRVLIVDPEDVLMDVEEELAGLFTSVAVRAGSPLRALLMRPAGNPASATTRAVTLGCTDLVGDDSCGRWLGQRPGELLKFLICRRYQVVHAQDIAAALWGHGGFVSSGTVRQCVHELRQKSEGGRPGRPELVLTRQCGYALNRGVVVDADDFAVHVRRGIAAMGRGQKEIAMVHLRQAVAMYRGDFLSDEPLAEWARPERDRLREHMEDALEGLAQLYLKEGEARTATLCMSRLAELRPFDIDTHRRLLSLLLAEGRHSHAQRAHEGFCERLSRDFSRAPGFTLADLVPEDRRPLFASA